MLSYVELFLDYSPIFLVHWLNWNYVTNHFFCFCPLFRGFTVNTAGRTHVFKPVSVQAMWWVIPLRTHCCFHCTPVYWKALLQWCRRRQSWFIMPPTGMKPRLCLIPVGLRPLIVLFFWCILKSLTNACLYVILFLNKCPGPPCRCCTKLAKFLAGLTISLEVWLSPGWATTKAASLPTRAALTSGTPWRTWRRHGQIHPSCLSTSKQGHEPTRRQIPAGKAMCQEGFIAWFECLFRPSERERTECLIKAKLRSIMTCQDLENVTCKQVKAWEHKTVGNHGLLCAFIHLKLLH